MLGIVVVSYKSDDLMSDFINRELQKIDVPWVCCVVNNAATEKSTARIAQRTGAVVVDNHDLGFNDKARVYILPSEENLGFAKGNNLGVEFLLKFFNCDYLLFSNNDIEIKSPNCLSTLIRRMESEDVIGAIGPRIFCLDGGEQLPHDGYVSIYRQIGWHLFPFLRKRRTTQNIETQKNPKESPMRASGFTYWVQGAFLVIRTSDFLRVGMFDPATFLYAEEPILAERLKSIGKKMYYENRVSILHYEGGTIVKQHGTQKSEYMVMQSNCYYYRNYLHYNSFLVWLYRVTFNMCH